MGKVYKGFDSALARNVAIKILPSAVVSDPSRVSRFVQEARAASALNHPHVVTIYDIGEERRDGEPESVRFIAMELIDGATLRDLIGGGLLDLRKGLKVATQVAEALGAAHAAGIIHRDLKPENIMVNSAGIAKVLDFGLAKLRSADDLAEGDDSRTVERASTPGTVLGTVGYMSPEQAQGRTVDPRADVFSLGCVLYEIATGRRAFRGDSSVDTLHKIIYDEPEPIRALRPDVPPDLARIVRKALAKDPDERYQSAKDLAIDLRDLMREIDSNPSGASMTSPPVTAPAAKRRIWPIAAACALVVLTAVLAVYFLRRPAPAAHASESMQITRITANGKVIDAAISPDGKYAAYVVSDQGEQTLGVRQMTSGQTLTLVPARRTAYWGLRFAPDSASIYYGVKDSATPTGTIYQISTLGGAPRRIIDDIDSPPAFSPDGAQMTFLRARHPTRDQSSVMVVKPDGTGARVLASVSAPEFFVPIFFAAPSWSPDGKLIAASVLDRVARKARIVSVDTASGAMQTIASPDWPTAGQVAWLPDQSGLVAIAGRQGSTRSQIWYVPYPAGEAQPITNDLFDYRIVSLSADGKSLVTVASDATADVWICRDGALPKRLNASKREGMYGLDSMPDGHLVITSIEAGKFDIWSMNEDGTGRTLLTRDENINRNPIVTTDGRSIVYLSQTPNTNEICRMNADGSGRRVLAKTAVPAPSLNVSPDGKWVVYEDLFAGSTSSGRRSVNGVMRVPMDGGAATRVTEELLSLPAFSPDGTRLAACLEDAATSRNYLAILPAAGGPVTRASITRVSEWELSAASQVRWTPDGTALIVNTVPGDRANLWIVPLDGKPMRRMTSFDEHILFAFSPLRAGKGWAVSRGDLSRDAVLISGFRPRP